MDMDNKPQDNACVSRPARRRRRPGTHAQRVGWWDAVVEERGLGTGDKEAVFASELGRPQHARALVPPPGALWFAGVRRRPKPRPQLYTFSSGKAKYRFRYYRDIALVGSG